MARTQGGVYGIFQPLVPAATRWPADPFGRSRLPDTDASELVLFDDEASKLMAQFDIDAAIVTHERWLPWLGEVLQGARDERLRPEVVGR